MLNPANMANGARFMSIREMDERHLLFTYFSFEMLFEKLVINTACASVLSLIIWNGKKYFSLPRIALIRYQTSLKKLNILKKINRMLLLLFYPLPTEGAPF